MLLDLGNLVGSPKCRHTRALVYGGSDCASRTERAKARERSTLCKQIRVGTFYTCPRRKLAAVFYKRDFSV